MLDGRDGPSGGGGGGGGGRMEEQSYGAPRQMDGPKQDFSQDMDDEIPF